MPPVRMHPLNVLPRRFRGFLKKVTRPRHSSAAWQGLDRLEPRLLLSGEGWAGSAFTHVMSQDANDLAIRVDSNIEDTSHLPNADPVVRLFDKHSGLTIAQFHV